MIVKPETEKFNKKNQTPPTKYKIHYISIVKTRSELITQLDRIVSKKVRGEGIVKCYTCDSYHQSKYLDAGHFIDRRWMGTRFDLRNVKPQCINCNRFRDSDEEIEKVFAKNLKKEHGKDIIKILESKKIENLDRLQIFELIEKMR